MCGIAGYIGKNRVDEATVGRTLELMRKRGPDFQGAAHRRFGDLNVHLLSSRLAIIDLDPRSNQPAKLGPNTLVYNGEIYNYIEVREELKKRGVAFETDCDTEVLLRQVLEHGPGALGPLEGMWAFALFNEEQGCLTLSRDRFGEKPLYYLEAPDGLYFGSEAKFIASLRGEALRRNERQLLRYLVHGYKSLYKNGETFHEGLKELPAGCNMTVRADIRPDLKPYWKPRYAPVAMSLEDAIAGARERLLDSVRIRLRADVPLAFCLSGGVDSSSIASIASKIFNCRVSAYSIIDPDERYNELGNIQATVADLNCPSHLVYLEKERSLDRLRGVIRYHDAPIATITYYIHNFLSEAIAKAGCKVAFSGTSADELFTGYYDHFLLHLFEMRGRPDYGNYLADWKSHISGFIRNPLLRDPDRYLKDPAARSHVYLDDGFKEFLKTPFHEEFTEREFTGSLLRNRMLNELFVEATPVILHEDDLNSMMHSVENRSPYLDSRLFDFAYSIPPEHLIRDGYGKYLLREAMKGILNDKVRLDRQKKGFNASILSIIDFEDKGVADELLAESPIFDLVDREKIAALFVKKELTNSFSKFLFSFVNAKLFLEQ